MSTVVALGHFCEVHGPRLVFYTIRNINEPQFVSQCPDLKFCSGCKAPLLEGYISTVQTVHSTAPDPPSPSSRQPPPRDSSGDHHHHHHDEEGSPLVTNSHSAPGGFSSSKSLRASSSTQHLSSIASTSASGGYVSRGTSTNNCTGVDCEATRERGGASSSGGGGAGGGATISRSTTTTEPSAGTKYYCSHSNYDHSHLSHLQTCISRTLSCELSPSNSVAFTSSDIWVIGTAFSLKDSQARGFHRRYCLIFTFLPEVPQCCRDPDSVPVDQETEYGGGSKHATSSSRGSSSKAHPSSNKSSKKGPKGRVPPQHHPQQHRQGCSSRDDYYSDGDCKGYTQYYGGGYPSLVPFYDYITEEFYNIAKNLQGRRVVSAEARDQEEEDGDSEGNKSEELALEEMLSEQVWSRGPALTPTFNVGAYANDSENVKKLLQLGVDLSRWEGRYGAIPLLYKSNFETTMKPIIEFLMDLQVEGPDLSRILTVNPFIFNEQLGNLKKRVEYLKVKKFEEDAISNIITRNPYWLSFSVPRIDRRLGFFQTYFGLTGAQVRVLASVGSSGPKLITYHLGRVKDVTFTIKEEMGFTSEEIVKLLLTRPRLWKEVPATLRLRFDYLHNEEKFSHADILRSPMLLLTRQRRLKERIGFLKKLGRAQFDPRLGNYISPETLCFGNDAEWLTDVARVPVAEYNNYLKTL